MAFVVSANVRLQVTKSANLRKQIEKSLGTDKPFPVDVKIDPRAKAKIAGLTKQLRGVRSASAGVSSGFKGIGSSLGGFVSATIVISKLTQVVGDAVSQLSELKDIVSDISVISGKSEESLSGLSREANRVASTFGSATTVEFLKASQTLLQTGKSIDETKKSLEILARAANDPTFGDLNGIVETQISLQSVFKLSVDESAQALSAMSALSSKLAVESQDLASAVKRSGAAWVQAGGNVNELLAVMATARSSTRLSADSIANAINTMAIRIQRSSTAEKLKEFNIELRSADGSKLLPIAKQIENIGKGLRALPKDSPAAFEILEATAGIRQSSKVSELLQGLEKNQNALNIAMQSGNRLTEVSAAQQDKVSVTVGRLSAKWTQLIQVMGEAGATDAIAGVLGKVEEILDAAIGLKDVWSSMAKVLKSVWDITPLKLYIDAINKIADGVEFVVNKSGILQRFVSGQDQQGKDDSKQTGVLKSNRKDFRERERAARGGGQQFFSVGPDVIPDGSNQGNGNEVRGLFETIKNRISSDKTFAILGNQFGPLEKLPSIIERVNQSGLKGIDLDQMIQRELSEFPDSVRNSVESVKDLTKLGTLTNKLVRVMEKDLQTLSANIEKRNKLEDRGTELRLGLEGIVGKRDNTNRDKQRLEIITGSKNATATGLTSSLKSANTNIASIQSRIDNVPGPERARLVEQLGKEQQARSRAIKGLQFLADVTNRLSVIESEKERKTKVDKENVEKFRQETLGLRGKDKRKRFRDIKNAEELSKTGNLSGIRKGDRKGAIELLKRFANTSIPSLGGKTGNDALRKIDDVQLSKGFEFSLESPSAGLPNRKGVFAESILAQKGLISGNKQESSIAEGNAPTLDFSSLATATGQLQTATQTLDKSITTAAGNMEQMAKTIPATVDFKIGGKVEVIFNGHETLKELQPMFKKMINSGVEHGINKLITDKFPKAGANFSLGTDTAERGTKDEN